MPASGSCTVGSRDGQPLPDPPCAPGAINSDVTQDCIDDTICKSGWTKTVRPSPSKTNRMKAVSARTSRPAAREIWIEVDDGASQPPR
ncbi:MULTISPECIES: hypothetical protein [Amycolatopsis]|uniref:hypothetical protein n=1 Tax=Amycolatopsis TaxID=1813 RepID=UPI000B8B057A|nr:MULTISPECIES: hypothetical protein [Amycolatopsis]OXM72302.1 hypothetical protein CF166_16025 [Amycolatopsis sp. KNN50.9b]